jgi:hypothetical protein
MGMASVTAEHGPGDRLGIGSDYHCVHEIADVRFRVVDWRPFDYFSALERDPLGSGLSYHETWEIEPGEPESIVRFSVALPLSADDTIVPATDPRAVAIKEMCETYGHPMLDGLRSYLGEIITSDRD